MPEATATDANIAALLPEHIREHYDFFAPWYRLLWGDHIHHGLFLTGKESTRQAQEQTIEHCFERAGLRRGARILDVGCGHGGTAIYLARKHECRVRGLTLSPRQALRARGNATRAGVSAKTEFDVVDVELASLEAAAYDAVWCMESTEHFRDKAAFFRKAAQSLRPGGRLMVTAWTGDMQRPRVREVARVALCPALATAQQYAEMISAAGLELLAQEDLSAQVQRTWEICWRRARLLWPALALFPPQHREFVRGIKTILEAYRCGDLSYTTIFAARTRAA